MIRDPGHGKNATTARLVLPAPWSTALARAPSKRLSEGYIGDAFGSLLIRVFSFSLPLSELEMDVHSEPFCELLARAKNGSHLDIHNLIDQVPDQYAEHGQAILETIGTVLEVPRDVSGFKPTTEHLFKIFCAWLALHKVAEWYKAGHTSPVDAKALIDESFAKKYLFWALILLRVTPSRTPLDPLLPSVLPDLQRGIYDYVPAFFAILILHPAITYSRFPPNLKPALLDITVAWWTALLDDGNPPFSPMGRASSDPDVDAGDPSTSMFLMVTHLDTQSMIASVLKGNICPPETFVERTIGRMRILTNINRLPHLSHHPSCTIEIENMGFIESATELLMSNERLRDLFMQQGVPGAYINVFATLGKKLELRSLANGPQSIKTQDAMYIDILVREAATVLLWVTTSSTSVLRHMNEVISNGAIQLVSSASLLRPDERKGRLDDLLDQLTLYSSYLEPFPALLKEVSLFIAPHGTKMPTSVHDFDWGSVRRTDRNQAFGLDAVAIKMIGQFVAKEHRVKLCDNLKHYDRQVGAAESKEQPEQVCSRCHTVVYCSAECQKEDWKAFHRSECSHMLKEYTERRGRDVVYSYHDRAFQASFMRYQYEGQVVDHDRSGVPYRYGRDGVKLINPFRPYCSMIFPSQEFIPREYDAAPRHVMPRLRAFFNTFSSTNGNYRGDDPVLIRAQNSRLVFDSFPLGPEDVNVILLLKRVHYLAFEGTHIDKMNQSMAFRSRGPLAKSDYVIQGALGYITGRRAWSIWRDRPSIETILGGASEPAEMPSY